MVLYKLYGIVSFTYYTCINSYYHMTHKNSDEGLLLVDKLINCENLSVAEVRNKTNKLFENNLNDYANDYSNIVSYIAGKCHLNCKLSTNESLDESEQKILNSINKSVDRVEPLSYSVNLFHGFEKRTNYNENKWTNGKTFSVPGFLSKTPSFKVATKFTPSYNHVQFKYLIVKYPIGSKHISLDIHSKGNEEYVYITHSNEKLLLVDVVKKFKFPYMYIFYICSLK